MFNFEGRQNLDWLAALCCPLASRVIMLLVFAALLALAVPAAHAAGCTGFEYFADSDNCDDGGWCRNFPDPFYVMVPASNFLTDYHSIYVDEQCEDPVPPDKYHGYHRSDYSFGRPGNPDLVGVAFAKKERQAMKVCELNADVEIAYVSKPDRNLTMYYCNPGKRMGPKRQRREHLFSFGSHEAGNAKQALKRCRWFAEQRPSSYPRRPNLAERRPIGGWDCWRTWTVSHRYLN